MINDYRIFRQIEQNILENKIEKYYRDDFYLIDWSNDVIGLFGERGVGKTTVMLQKRIGIKKVFYFSTDNVSVKTNGLFHFVFFCFQNFNIEQFYIDEIFSYPQWNQELKNIIDSIPQIKIVFSGSSSLALYDGIIDLGRRVYDYHINTLSFREFLKLKYSIQLEKISFEELIDNSQKISLEYSLKFKEVYFHEYLKTGAYPFGLTIYQ